VVFRDLKLDNTLLDGKRPGRVKLCDFGFAKQWEQENRNMFTHIGCAVQDHKRLDTPGLSCAMRALLSVTRCALPFCCRTPVYMSPEQLQDGDANGQGYLGTAVDVWAAGVLLIVMLLGGSAASGAACCAVAHRRTTAVSRGCSAPSGPWPSCRHDRVSSVRTGVPYPGCLCSGTFPFDHTENPDPNCKEAHTEVWAQQTKGSWSEVPHIKKAVQKVPGRHLSLPAAALVPAMSPRSGPECTNRYPPAILSA
jgi:serine/threonine protein kinase